MNRESIKNSLDKELRLLKKEGVVNAVKSFTLTERVAFSLFVCLFAVSFLYIIWHINNRFVVVIPTSGGTLREGLVGYPRYINPLLTITDSGQDIGALVYSGLTKATPSGDLAPDLADSWTVSPDGITYTFNLKKNIYFQDGTPVTADDVIFTVQKAEDPDLHSPEEANWSGVKANKISDSEVQFVLPKPYAPFIQNTIMGILPKHIWQNVSDDEFAFSDYNINPIGSGPYEISSIKRDSDGLPDYYVLKPFSRYVGGKAYISNIIIRFYTNENDLVNALEDGEITSASSISPDEATILQGQGVRLETAPLPRVFGVFFNQNSAPVLANIEVRQALNIAVDRNNIIKEVLDNYGSAIDGPLPSDIYYQDLNSTSSNESAQIKQAQAILMQNGWATNTQGVMEKKTKKTDQTLSFSISTADTPDLVSAANIVAAEWKAVGADVSVKVFDVGDLNQNIIRTRNYDSLLFGEVIGRDQDLFAFWDSSQRNDPGLNIAMYTNSTADKYLEDDRTQVDPSKRLDDEANFEKQISQDVPAVFLYSPDFIYAVPSNLQGLNLKNITTPPDRFMEVNKWYLNTDKVWKIFVNKFN